MGLLGKIGPPLRGKTYRYITGRDKETYFFHPAHLRDGRLWTGRLVQFEVEPGHPDDKAIVVHTPSVHELVLATLPDMPSEDLQRRAALEAHRSNVEWLQDSFHSKRPTPRYADSGIAAAYLLAYYASSCEMARNLAHDLRDRTLAPLFKHVAEVVILCGGAAPEASGVIQYIAESEPDIKTCRFTIVDSIPGWIEQSREILELSTAAFWGGSCETDFVPLRLSSSTIDGLVDRMQRADLILMQNAVNEMETEDALELLSKTVNSMRPGAKIAVSLASEHFPHVGEVFTKLQRIAGGRLKIIRGWNEPTSFYEAPQPPDYLADVLVRRREWIQARCFMARRVYRHPLHGFLQRLGLPP